MSTEPNIIRIGDTKDRLGESPVWDDRTQLLYWIDSLAGLIHKLIPATGAVEDFEISPPVGALAIRQDGGAILALRHRFGRYDFDAY